jgi:tRNA (mo5U34)-methyltransferase
MLSEEQARPGSSADAALLRDRVAGQEWYHTFELAPGVVTPGWFDTRALPARLPFPASLEGRRCLDIGTFDGFWAFEMERRGAEEVLAIDILDPRGWDWPVGSAPEVAEAFDRRKRGGEGFELVRDALASTRVTREERSIYDLEPAAVGEFDFVYLGSLLLHLRDPVGALTRVRSVVRGQLLVLDAIDLPLSLAFPRRPLAHFDGRGRPWWWHPNQTALVRMLEAAGFELERPPKRTFMPPGPGHPRFGLRQWRALTSLRYRVGRQTAFTARFGDPHCALLARPARG